LPPPKWLKAESGTIVSLAVLTAESVEVVVWPVVANALFAALRATSPAACPALAAAVPLLAGGVFAATMPGRDWVFWSRASSASVTPLCWAGAGRRGNAHSDSEL
jgi:hypothetical protein